MLKCAVQVMRWRDTRAHRPAICTRNRCTHYVQFNEQPLLAEAWYLFKNQPMPCTKFTVSSNRSIWLTYTRHILLSPPWNWLEVQGILFRFGTDILSGTGVRGRSCSEKYLLGDQSILSNIKHVYFFRWPLADKCFYPTFTGLFFVFTAFIWRVW